MLKFYCFFVFDVVVYDIGDSGEEFGFEFGCVCFFWLIFVCVFFKYRKLKFKISCKLLSLNEICGFFISYIDIV